MAVKQQHVCKIVVFDGIDDCKVIEAPNGPDGKPVKFCKISINTRGAELSSTLLIYVRIPEIVALVEEMEAAEDFDLEKLKKALRKPATIAVSTKNGYDIINMYPAIKKPTALFSTVEVESVSADNISITGTPLWQWYSESPVGDMVCGVAAFITDESHKVTTVINGHRSEFGGKRK